MNRVEAALVAACADCTGSTCRSTRGPARHASAAPTRRALPVAQSICLALRLHALAPKVAGPDYLCWRLRSAARADLACWRGPTRAPKAPGSARRRRSAWRGWGSARAGGGAWPPMSRPWLTAVAILPSPRRIAVAPASTEPPRAGARGACGSECRSAGSSWPRLRCQYLLDSCIPSQTGAAKG